MFPINKSPQGDWNSKQILRESDLVTFPINKSPQGDWNTPETVPVKIGLLFPINKSPQGDWNYLAILLTELPDLLGFLLINPRKGTETCKDRIINRSF